MKKSIVISVIALVFSAAALVKAFMPMQNAVVSEGSVSKEAIEKVLNDNPVLVINAMQQYEQKLREQMEAEANAMIKNEVESLNNYSGDIYEGKKDAKIVLVEFFDYACGYCHRLYPEIEKVAANNSDIKIVYKPLAFVSPFSETAAKAVTAAKNQGKFKQLHQALFAAQEPLSEEMIFGTAEKAGLDVDQLKKDMESEEVNQVMMFNNELAGKIQINGVPTMVLNGELLQTLDGGVIQERIDSLK